jgi:hypothetical protein
MKLDENLIKLEYDKLLEAEDLQTLFPNMKCNWEDDKQRFIKQWKINQEILKELYVNKIE